MSDGVGARSVAIEAVLLMLPGQIVKTGCKKGFVQSHQTVLPADELVRLGHILGFLAGIQWGRTKTAQLVFPVSFTTYSHIYTQHNGSGWQQTWVRDDSPLVQTTAFSSNAAIDIHWLAIGC